MLVFIYLLGCLVVLLELTYKTWERTSFAVDYFTCLITVLYNKETYKYIFLSWIYFVKF